ncbi:unnamed protein product [Cylicocyclus nassatus]|uniref:Uncharacterized protein n=1 Tax=Cylicocyclus nassatus TaxID=53992 RepID=A0AA36MEP2_CYLNA|nr:unnamed protein product [Cylicocyclus nassatus]
MLTSVMVMGVSTVLAFQSVTNAFRLREYRRPTCSEEETCSYKALGVVFALCDCPGEEKLCPKEPENAVEHRGTRYYFCSPRIVPACKDGDISTTVTGIQTAIHCTCPEEHDLIQEPSEEKGVTSYACRQRRICNSTEACGLRSFVGEMRLCECPTGTTCVYQEETDGPLSRQSGKCLTL